MCLAIAASATTLAPMPSLLSQTPPMSSPFIQGSHLPRYYFVVIYLSTKIMFKHIPRVPPWGFPSSQPTRLSSFVQRPSQGKPCLFMGPGIPCEFVHAPVKILKMHSCGGSFWIFSGAVGTAAVQIARALGAIVVGTAGTKDGMDVVTRFSSILFPKLCFLSSLLFSVIRCGAHHVFNHNHKSYEKKMVSESACYPSFFPIFLFNINS